LRVGLVALGRTAIAQRDGIALTGKYTGSSNSRTAKADDMRSFHGS
jgi:hypothetical protein